MEPDGLEREGWRMGMGADGLQRGLTVQMEAERVGMGADDWH